MPNLQVTETPKGYFTLEGELNRNTIAKSAALGILDKNTQNSAKGSVATLDMSGVSHSDTAGLAWLMNFLKYNQSQNVSVELKNIPESLIKLAKISDVDSFLSVQ
ncbi:STAS domain-containing protein [Paraglaciecola arctica]|uniref:STAS domain-containing protein n=1 Tax=Paraglaciecola arctica TaxID=1128911 RepID=UPI001C075590|nr:STAS domain-containing protein [Paraglaciecola arctica]